MKNLLTILLLSLSFSAFGQTGQWDSTEAIIYPTSTTGKIVLASGDTLYLYDVLPADSGKAYINRRSPVKMIYDFNQDATNDTIPAVCLFSNYDYDSLFYSRISSMTINPDSTLNLPERITEIEVYSSATDRNSYFNVPEIASTGVIYIPDDYATFTLATAAATTGDTIYIRSGIYLESTYLLANKSVTYIGIGSVKYKGLDATYNLRTSANNIKFKNIWMPSNGQGAVVNSVSPVNMYFENCLMSGSSYGINSLSSTGIISLDKCVLNLNTGTTGYGIYCRNNSSEVINECYLKSRITYGKASGTSQPATNIQIIYSKIDAEYNVFSPRDEYVGLGTDSSVVNIKYSDIISVTLNVDLNDNSGILKIIGSNIYAYDWHPTILCDSSNYDSIFIYDNNFYHASDTGYIGLAFRDQHYVDLQNNTFNITRWGGATDIDIDNNWLDSVNFKFNYNRIDHRNKTVNMLAIGNVAHSADNTIKGECIGNWYRDIGYFYPNDFGFSHGMVVYYQSDVDFIYNRIEGAGLAIVLKSQGLNCSNSLVYGNILKNCNVGLESKGSTNITFANNTIYNNSDSTTFGFDIIRNSTDSYENADSCILVNNIVFDSGNNANYELIHYELEQDTLFSNHNLLYTVNGKVQGDYTTFDDWQIYGQDLNSYNTNPNFNSSTNLWPNTPFTGTDLGEDYNLGLDVSSAWPESIATKLQPSLWQIGVYVKDITSKGGILRGYDPEIYPNTGYGILRVNGSQQTDTTWILSTGEWNDNGLWEDDNTWNDDNLLAINNYELNFNNELICWNDEKYR